MSTKVIHKHTVAINDDVTTHILPADAQIIHVGMQNGKLCYWEEHSGNGLAMVLMQYRVVGTGHAIPLTADYIGTAFDGGFVWHLYELEQE